MFRKQSVSTFLNRSFDAIKHAFIVLSLANLSACVSNGGVTKKTDCEYCEDFVQVPAGEFLRGSSDGPADERPASLVVISNPFNMSAFEVTVAEYAKFVLATGHRPGGGCFTLKNGKWEQDDSGSWLKPGFEQKSNEPVVCVNYYDAKKYAGWLSSVSGQRFRLPTESEWEYVLKTGKPSKPELLTRNFSLCERANVAYRKVGSTDTISPEVSCKAPQYSTKEVGSYEPNSFGIYDLVGNVSEWVEDCWNGNYSDVPINGAAMTIGNSGTFKSDGQCIARVVRGSSFSTQSKQWLHDSFRNWQGAPNRRSDIGFRLVMDVN